MHRARASRGWGWFLYQGVVDPLGGINTLWPLFGIANQMLAGIALIFVCVVLVKMKRERYLWVAAVPTAWLLVCTLTAGWQKLFHDDPKIGFLANARRFADALARGEVLAPAKSLEEMQRVIFNNQLDAALCALFMGVVVLDAGVRDSRRVAARRSQHADRDGDAACGARCGSLSNCATRWSAATADRAPGDRRARLRRLRRARARAASRCDADDARSLRDRTHAGALRKRAFALLLT